MALDFLSGTRVVDLSQYIPGPYASLLLADQGAEVLKIERPGGEAMRAGFGPRGSDGISPFYKVLNGGKTVVEMNLKSDGDRECFLALVAQADVLLESFRPGVMERLGFSPETLRSRFPSLVMCSLSGYGQTGPYRLRAGHDINYLALTGVLAGTCATGVGLRRGHAGGYCHSGRFAGPNEEWRRSLSGCQPVGSRTRLASARLDER